MNKCKKCGKCFTSLENAFQHIFMGLCQNCYWDKNDNRNKPGVTPDA